MPNRLARARNAAFEQQSGRCYYCALPMWNAADPKVFAATWGLKLPQAAGFRCTAEHLHARCDGGRDGRANIVAACWTCNVRRHRRKRPPAPLIYRRLVHGRLAKGRWHPDLHPGRRIEPPVVAAAAPIRDGAYGTPC